MLVLVTGGAGFIGRHLVGALIGEGHKVRVLDILLRGRPIETVAKEFEHYGVEFIHGDIRYRDTLQMAMEGVETVFHMAATNINRSRIHQGESHAINLQGTINVAEAFLRYGGPGDGKFIFSSSASVYGRTNKLPMSETDELHPITPYCHAKHQSEIMLNLMGQRKGLRLRWVALRYFNVYGPGQNTDAHYTAVIPTFIRQALAKEPIVIDGNGRQTMDLVHVGDVVQANLLAMQKEDTQEVFNVGSGISTSVQELAERIRANFGNDNPIHNLYSSKSVIVQYRQANINKARDILGYEPKVKLEDGLKEVIRYEKQFL